MERSTTVDTNVSTSTPLSRAPHAAQHVTEISAFDAAPPVLLHSMLCCMCCAFRSVCYLRPSSVSIPLHGPISSSPVVTTSNVDRTTSRSIRWAIDIYIHHVSNKHKQSKAKHQGQSTNMRGQHVDMRCAAHHNARSSSHPFASSMCRC